LDPKEIGLQEFFNTIQDGQKTIDVLERFITILSSGVGSAA